MTERKIKAETEQEQGQDLGRRSVNSHEWVTFVGDRQRWTELIGQVEVTE